MGSMSKTGGGEPTSFCPRITIDRWASATSGSESSGEGPPYVVWGCRWTWTSCWGNGIEIPSSSKRFFTERVMSQ